MALINCISIGVTAALLITGAALIIYYNRKLKNLDGFIGIIPSEREEKDHEIERRLKRNLTNDEQRIKNK